ncbi:MAG: PIN domain-containing protein [Planctomycetes bacterium]|nr:PIN domain-containing protein [Planctomycetota bacterium]
MEIALDTGPTLGLLYRNDPYHKPTSIQYQVLRKSGTNLILPRISYVESLGHITREIRKKRANSNAGVLAEQFQEKLAEFQLHIIEHIPQDFSVADAIWTKYREWPVDYPDVLIAATATRLDCSRLWTLDTAFERLLIHAFPGMENIRNRH